MAAPRSFRVEAVVLRHVDWGEADRLLTLYTLERGKLRAVARGARRIKSRKAGHLEPFTHVLLQLASGRDLPIVTQAETVDAYLPLREDLLKMALASYVVELLDRFTYEEEGDVPPGLFYLLTETLQRIVAGHASWTAVRYYEVRMLDFLGFRPHLFECARCGQEIRPVPQYFSFSQGGVLCPSCGAQEKMALPVSVEALKYLRHFQRSTYAQAARANPIPAVREEIEGIMHRYLTFLLERDLNSPAFIHRLQSSAGGAAGP